MDIVHLSATQRRRNACDTFFESSNYIFRRAGHVYRVAIAADEIITGVLIRRLCGVQRPTRQGPERLACFRIEMGVRWSRCRLDSVAVESGRISFSIAICVRETYRDLQPPSTGSILSKATHPTQNIPSRRH